MKLTTFAICGIAETKSASRFGSESLVHSLQIWTKETQDRASIVDEDLPRTRIQNAHMTVLFVRARAT